MKYFFKICLFVGLFFLMFLDSNSSALAASGPVYVYYHTDNSLYDRYPTFSYTNEHMSEIGYTVEARDNWDSSGLLYALADAKIVVYHYHGSQGKQYTDTSYNGIGAKNANNTSIKNVSTISNNSLNQLKLAIMYGCHTGEDGYYGNLPQTIVNKGAQTAIAWKVDTPILGVNEWNRLFFEKAKSDSIVESMRHADYWLYSVRNSDEADTMKYNRNEAGDIYGYVY